MIISMNMARTQPGVLDQVRTLIRNKFAHCMLLAAITCSLPQAQAQTIPLVIEAGSVDIAQTHVLNGDGRLGPNGQEQPRIIGERNILFKANFIANQAGIANARLSAWLTLFDAQNQKTTIRLANPLTQTTFPTSIDAAPAKFVHSFNDSYSATIPATWVKPGLTWELSWAILGTDGKAIGSRSMHSGALRIGPPHKLALSMIDVQWFQPEVPFKGPTNELFDEMRQKLPISSLDLRRSIDNVFPQIAMPALLGKPPQIVSTLADWEVLYGDGEVTRALSWAVALQKAAGVNYRDMVNFCVINHFAGAEGGVGNDDYFCASEAGNDGLFWHEFGHSFRLPHWGEGSVYPYKDPDNDGPLTYTSYLGLSTVATDRPEGIQSNSHAGPYWAFDDRDTTNATGTLIAPWVDGNNDGTPDHWRADPMQGGGARHAKAPFRLAAFSDYSINRINERLDDKVSWFSAKNAWISDADWAAKGAGWYSSSSNGYKPFTTDGTLLPLGPDQDVFSILIAGSMASNAPAVPFTLVYPVIGPYKSNVRKLYNPITERAALAASGRCPAGGCDLTLRVVQGGVTGHYALEVDWDTAKPSSNLSSFFETAINVPARSGSVTSVLPITKIELLLTPNVGVLGVPASPIVLKTLDVAGPAYQLTSSAQATLGYFGGGVPSELLVQNPGFEKLFTCPSNSLLSGIDVSHDNTNIRGLGFSCAQLNANGTLGAPVPLTGPTTFGDMTRTRAQITCPPHLISGVRGRGQALVNKIGLICGTISGVMSGAPEFNNAAVGGDWGDFIESKCPVGNVVTGVKLVTYDIGLGQGVVVDDLKLICSGIQAGTIDVTDSDGDGVNDHKDNCPRDHNPGQENTDTHHLGDACQTRLLEADSSASCYLSMFESGAGTEALCPSEEKALYITGNSNTDHLWSLGREFKLVLTPGGQLEIFNNSNQKMWSTPYISEQKSPNYAMVLENDELALFNRDGKKYWGTGTEGANASHFILRADGVLYLECANGSIAWNSPNQPKPGHTYSSRPKVSSCDIGGDVRKGIEMAEKQKIVLSKLCLIDSDIRTVCPSGSRYQLISLSDSIIKINGLGNVLIDFISGMELKGLWDIWQTNEEIVAKCLAQSLSPTNNCYLTSPKGGIDPTSLFLRLPAGSTFGTLNSAGEIPTVTLQGKDYFPNKCYRHITNDFFFDSLETVNAVASNRDNFIAKYFPYYECQLNTGDAITSAVKPYADYPNKYIAASATAIHVVKFAEEMVVVGGAIYLTDGLASFLLADTELASALVAIRYGGAALGFVQSVDSIINDYGRLGGCQSNACRNEVITDMALNGLMLAVQIRESYPSTTKAKSVAMSMPRFSENSYGAGSHFSEEVLPMSMRTKSRVMALSAHDDNFATVFKNADAQMTQRLFDAIAALPEAAFNSEELIGTLLESASAIKAETLTLDQFAESLEELGSALKLEDEQVLSCPLP